MTENALDDEISTIDCFGILFAIICTIVLYAQVIVQAIYKTSFLPFTIWATILLLPALAIIATACVDKFCDNDSEEQDQSQQAVQQV
jgi:membrane protein implicated in regulation of membrane protease activity